jgi:L-alanine-DL-glutamate epimerase-like enolase superfamily enzyme
VISLEAEDLKLRHAFKTSRSTTNISRSYYFKADRAVGEGSPVRFYGETAGTVEAAFGFVAAQLPAWDDPRHTWPVINRLLGYNFALKCGLDLLYWDHRGKQEQAPVGDLLEIEPGSTVCTAFSIGIASAEEMQAEVKRRSEFKVLKLKVGFDEDVDVVRAIREVTNVPLYVDANGGWTVEEACQKLPLLHKLGVVLCEQPIFSGVREDWERVREAADMPVMVDEYCQRPEDVGHWAGWVDGINVKLQKCGGLTPAYEMIQRARDLGMRVMLGCMIESSVSIAAATVLAPLVDYVDLDSHLYLDFDPYQGVQCDNGCLRLSGKPGLGVTVRERTDV